MTDEEKEINCNFCIMEHCAACQLVNIVKERDKEITELKEKLKDFESGNAVWQGYMDETIKQNLELKKELKDAVENQKAFINWVFKTYGETEYLK